MAATDPSFLLTATAQDFANYFPGELANGYVSTFTSRRGTVTKLSYMAAFMGYGKRDISRPAAIPGWNGINYRPVINRQPLPWLNQVPMRPASFQRYHQVLNLHDGTLTTRYRFVDASRATNVRVTSFVSEASPHLAAIRLSVTPQFDGAIELSFPLLMWAPYAPRLPLATLTGARFRTVLQAHHLSLDPTPPSTPDRAAIWYYGYTHVLGRGVDAKTKALWLNGRARNGLSMAEAAVVGLPRGVEPTAIRVERGKYRMALDVRFKAMARRTYTFTKYVALSRKGWGGDARADLALAQAARAHGFKALLDAQRSAWAKLWESDIRIDGDPRAQQVVHSDLYYLLANTAPDAAWGLGACGLTTGYVGHVFWDSDSWIFPALLLLHPQRARSIVLFRDRTLPEAERRAQEAGFAGAKYPWESDPQYGTEQVMDAAHRLSVGEIHVNADIAIAQWQYWLATHDRKWLAEKGWPVIRALAQFWVSRAVYDPMQHRYDIRDVVSVMEPYAHVDDDTFTNADAVKALRIAVAAARVVGVKPNPRWAKVAKGLHLPSAGGHYVGFAGAKPTGSEDLDLDFLNFPSVDLAMPNVVRKNDYDIAVGALKHVGHVPTTMGLAPLAITASTLGDDAALAHWLALDDAHGTLKGPFNVRTETPRNNTGYFLTGSAGFVQAIVYGITGLRVEKTGLVQAYPETLPVGWKSMTLTDLVFNKKHYEIVVYRTRDGKVRMRKMPYRASLR
ncbi:MAG TPA: glycoside hydrolase family 65 protein [Rhodanobacteraceae bacterium]